MLNLKQFLEKYANFTPPERLVTKTVAAVVSEFFNTPITEEMVVVRNTKAFVEGSGALKSELVFNKKQLLSEIERRVGSKAVTDLL